MKIKNSEERDICRAVDKFSKKMKEKMIYKSRKYGFRGWNMPMCLTGIEIQFENRFMEQIKHGNQEIDIANLAMMIYFLRNK